MLKQERLLTGDTPTGRLHLGHWVGSIENRLKLQDQYDCFFLIANIHAFTTRYDKPGEIRQSVLDIALDYLSVGIDPQKCTIFVQSEIPAIAELTILLSMLLPYPRLMRNPTIKEELITKNLGENYSFGFLLYPVGQIADILAFRPSLVPVGEDQLPHIEMTREVARRFNQVYCRVDPHTEDGSHLDQGGLFPIPKIKEGRVKRLVGTGAPNEAGQLYKMSKSLNNAIFLSDDPDTINDKIMKKMYTDPNRIRVTDKGSIENNPLWIFHDAFNPDKTWVKMAKERYSQGAIGDVECKKRLIDVLVELIEPKRQRRVQLENNMDYVLDVLCKGNIQANEIANKTLFDVKTLMKQVY